jgi:hypothetical protein
VATPNSGTGAIAFPLSPDTRIDALLLGSEWASPSLTYSFVNAGSSFSTDLTYGYGPSTDLTSEPWNPHLSYFDVSMQSAAISALAKWGAVANVGFTPATDFAGNCGDLRFAFSDIGNAQAEAFSPDIGAGGDIWFSYTARTQSFAEGRYNYLALVHEIGHALGLKHPFDSVESSPYVLPPSLDTESYTVMSYSAQGGNLNTDFSYWPTTPMVLDIQAMQYLYGANMAYNAGNTTYRFSQGADYHQTIWDGGGRDTISYDGTDACVIDLRQGAGSTMGNPVDVIDAFSGAHIASVSDVWIAMGAAIENASGGSGANRLIGNEVPNVLSGGSGNDTISGEAGNDRIDGGGGADVVLFSGSSSDYTVTFNAATGRYAVGDHNRSRDGTDVVSGVETFQFSDGSKSASQLAIAAPVGGDARTVVAINEAFFGAGPTPSGYAAALGSVTTAGDSQFAVSVGNGFAAVDSGSLSISVLSHLGVAAGTLGGGDPDASFEALEAAVSSLFSSYATVRGQIVLNMATLLAGLEADSVYGDAAAAFQNLLAADYAALGLVGVAAQDPFLPGA